MFTDKEFIQALQKMCRKAGSQLALSQMTGTSHTAINNILNERSQIENVTIGTMRRLFPDMQVVLVPKDNEPVEKCLIAGIQNLTESDKLMLLAAMFANFSYAMPKEINIVPTIIKN